MEQIEAKSNRRLARIQAASGVAFAFFLSLHLATTISAGSGPQVYDSFLNGLRAIYRPNVVVEILLIGLPASVHMVCAVMQVLYRRKHRPLSRPSAIALAHRWTGYFLLIVIVGHVFATRIMPAVATGATATGAADYSYLAYSVLNWPIFMNPYYFLLGSAGGVHLCLGLATAVKILAPRKIPMRAVQALAVGSAATVLVFVVVGVTSIISHADRAERSRFGEYEAVYKTYMPFMEPTLHLPKEPPSDSQDETALDAPGQ